MLLQPRIGQLNSESVACGITVGKSGSQSHAIAHQAWHRYDSHNTIDKFPHMQHPYESIAL